MRNWCAFRRAACSTGTNDRWTHSASLAARVAPAGQLPPPRLNYRAIVEDEPSKSHNALIRKSSMPLDTISSIRLLFSEHRHVDNMLNAKRAQQNALIKRLKDMNETDRETLIEDAKVVKAAIHTLEQRLSTIDKELLSHALLVPNDTHPDVPVGPESAAVVKTTHGPLPMTADPGRDHVRIASHFHLVDFNSGALSSGSSWFYLLNAGAQLEHALSQYAISIALARGFSPVVPPDVVHGDIVARCGFAPRDAGGAQQFYELNSQDLILAATAEVPLAALFAGRTLEPCQLPRRAVALGHAFRAEAGAHGKDTRGLFRVHQFTKIELVSVTTAEQSDNEMENIRATQEEIFGGLNFPFRVLEMPTEELGASAYRKYDIEAWMPGRGSWGEISSASNCTDFQARRLHIRHGHQLVTESRSYGQDMRPRSLPFAHTLNGTAAAIPRLIVTLLENGAKLNKYGEITGLCLPAVLRPFWLSGIYDTSFIEWV